MKKRTERPFLLFAGLDYYAAGGMDDYKGSFSDLQSAIDRVESLLDEETCRGESLDWAQIATWLDGKLVPFLWWWATSIQGKAPHNHLIRQWQWEGWG